ncbi:hypothetical protein WA158_006491 [Blastocystis sp. Blastoise]
MIFNILILLLTFNLVFGQDCVNAVVTKQNKGSAYKEEYYLYDRDDNSEKCHYKAGLLDNNKSKSCTVCLKPYTRYEIVMNDSGGNGWGSSKNNDAKITVEQIGYTILSDTMAYGSDGVYSKTVSFYSGLAVAPSSSWSYIDSEQSGDDWKLSSFDASSWASGSSFPSIATTRYYRYTITYPNDISQLSAIEVAIMQGSGYVIYIEGQEVTRQNMPTGSVTYSTRSTGTDTSNKYKRISVSARQYILSSTFTIAIEVHTQEGSSDTADFFNAWIRVDPRTSGSRINGLMTYAGSCSASYDDYSDEHCAQGLDGLAEYKWYGGNKEPKWISFTFYDDRRDWIGSYGMRSGNDIPARDPSTWQLMGSNDNGNTWELIDYRENQYFISRLQEIIYYVPSNRIAYNSYRLNVLQVASGNEVQLSDLNLYSTNTDILTAGIHYPETEFHLNMGVNSINVTPTNTGYISYTCTPTLPDGITINTNTGTISGIPTSSPLTTSYSICAVSTSLGDACTTITIDVIGCSQPSKARFDIIKSNKNGGTTESWKMYNSENELIQDSTGLSNTEQSFSYCVPAGIYTFVLQDGGNNGWDAGSYLTIYMFSNGEDIASRYIIGRLSVMYVGTATYQVNTQHYIWQNLHWKSNLITDSIPEAWYTTSYSDSDWTIQTTPIETTTNIWLFRNTFEITNITAVTGFNTRIYTRGGYIVYINGQELYRYNIAAGALSSSSIPLSMEDTFSWKSVSGKVGYLNLGTNTMAIAIINTPSSTATTSTFMAVVYSISSSNEISRTWDITATATSNRDDSNVYNLFDYDLNSRWIAYANLGDTQSIIVTFNNRAEYINKYCITSHFDAPQHDPRSWTLESSNDNGNTYISIASEQEIYWDGRGERQCFFITSTPSPVSTLKLTITSARENLATNSYAISELEFLIEDLDSLVIPDLSYTPNTILAYRNQVFPGLSISSKYFHHFTITPSLPDGLTIDVGDGQIMGSSSTSLSATTYTISAINHLGISQSTQLTITIDICATPNILFKLEYTFEEKGEEASFILKKRSDNSIVDSRDKLISWSTNTYTYCNVASIYDITLYDTANDGWGNGSYKVILEDNTVLTSGTVTSGQSPKTISINIGKIIHPTNSIWKVFYGVSEPSNDWNTVSFNDMTWTSSSLSAITSTSSTTTYFRLSFIPVDFQLYSAYEIVFYTKAGFIAYLNGKEIYRVNMPTEDLINKDTLSTNIFEEWTAYTIVLHTQFNPLQEGVNNILAFEYHTNGQIDTSCQFSVSMSMMTDNTYRVVEGTYWSDIITTGDEGTSMLFDNNINTKALRDNNGLGALFEWKYTNRREVINRFIIGNGNDCNKRHPTGWVIEGSNDEQEWTSLQTTHNYEWTSFKSTRIMDVPNDIAYQYYRLRITEMNGDYMNFLDWCSGGKFQLSEFQLYSKRLVSPCSAIQGYSATLNSQWATRSCDSGYSGQYKRQCQEGVFSEEIDECSLAIPTISYSTTSYTLTTKITIDPIVPTLTGLNVTLAITPLLPEGLSFDIYTGIITGMTDISIPTTEYTITIANEAGSAVTSISLTINVISCPIDGIWPSTPIEQTYSMECTDSNYEGSISRSCLYDGSNPTWGDIVDTCILRYPIITFVPSTYIFFANEPILPIIPITQYIIDQGYTIEPSLPQGLVLDTTTGIITGTSSTSSSLKEYILTGRNSANRTGSATVTITVKSSTCIEEYPWPSTEHTQTATVPCDPSLEYEGERSRTCVLGVWGSINTDNCILRFPYNVTYPSIIAVHKDFPMTPVTPTYLGRVDSWVITPLLPSGLLFNTVTGTISGTGYTMGDTVYSIQAINSRGASQVSITLRVVDTICDYEGWPDTEVGAIATKPCEDTVNYDGYQQATCLAGSPAYFSPVDTSNCLKKAPTDVYYTPSTVYVEIGDSISLTAHFTNIVEQIIISPSLPQGVLLDPITGNISGSTTIPTLLIEYHVIFKNSDNSAAPITITISVVPKVCYSDTIWTETPKGETASIPCSNPSQYEGTQTRVCNAGDNGYAPSWGAINSSGCKKRTPYDISYTPNTLTIYKDEVATLTPVFSGLVETITITPSLPSGLSISQSTGIISGTPSIVSSQKTYSIVFANSDNTAEAVTVSITVLRSTCATEGDWIEATKGTYSNIDCEDSANYEGFRARLCSVVTPNTEPIWGTIDNSNCKKKAPSSISYPSTTIYAEIGSLLVVIPSFSGLVETIIVTPSLPNGLSISQTSGTISGTPTTAQSITSYSLTFKNSNKSAEPITISIVITPSTCSATGIWSVTSKGQMATASCADPENYEGIQTRQCIHNGQGIAPSWGSINTSACKKRSPYSINYDSIVGEHNVPINVAPTVFGIVENVQITPSLPQGLTYSTTTGAITGIPSIPTLSQEYTITFSNSDNTSTPYVFTIEIKGYCSAEGDWPKTERGQIAYIDCTNASGIRTRACGNSIQDIDYSWKNEDNSLCVLINQQEQPEYGFTFIYTFITLMNTDSTKITSYHKEQLRLLLGKRLSTVINDNKNIVIVSVSGNLNTNQFYSDNTQVNLRLLSSKESTDIVIESMKNYTSGVEVTNDLKSIDSTVFQNTQVYYEPSTITMTQGPALSPIMLWSIIGGIIIIVVIVVIVVIAVVMNSHKKKTRIVKIKPANTVKSTQPKPKPTQI